jgi:hypothetical protein
MTFYGKDPEPKTTPRLKTFKFRVDGDTEAREVKAQNVYFYDSGHIGFWNDTDDGDRMLVLAVKALDVWEEPVEPE